MYGSNGGEFKTRFEDVGEDEVVGERGLGAEHVAEEGEGGGVGGGVGGVGSDEGGEEVGVVGREVVKDETRVREVGECCGAEANEFEGVEVSMGVAKGCEEPLELLQVLQLVAFA